MARLIDNENVIYDYIETADGISIDGDTATNIRPHVKAIFHEKVSQTPDLTWAIAAAFVLNSF